MGRRRDREARRGARVSVQLTAVRRATRRRNDGHASFVASLRAARQAGHTLQEIAQAAGISRQYVSYLLNGDPRKGEDRT